MCTWFFTLISKTYVLVNGSGYKFPQLCVFGLQNENEHLYMNLVLLIHNSFSYVIDKVLEEFLIHIQIAFASNGRSNQLMIDMNPHQIFVTSS